MDPELIAQVLDDACKYDSLNFQIMVQESTLHIYINRELDIELDYDQLVKNITDALITINASWEGFWLYSRIMGEIDPDWQTYVELQTDLSDNEADPWIEKTENLIIEAKESLKDLKYLNDKDISELEELDDAILNKNSFLLVMESAEEVDKSTGEIEEELEDLFEFEELDDSILDKNSHLLAEESAEEVDKSTGEIEEELEDLFGLEELDDSILDKNSHLLAKESAEEVDNSIGEFADKDFSKPEALDDAILNEKTFLLIDDIENEIEEQQTEELENLFVVENLDNFTEESEEEPEDLFVVENLDDSTEENEEEPEDLFSVEELDDSILDRNSHLLAKELVEEVDNSTGAFADKDFSEPEALDDSILNEQTSLLIDDIENEIEEQQTEELEDLFIVEDLDNSAEESEEEPEDLFAVEDSNNESPSEESDPSTIDSDDIEDFSNNNHGIEEEDIFVVEELEDEIPNSESDDLAVDFNENMEQNENSSKETVNFSEYCFVRNQRLLESDLVAPKLHIANLLSFFHDLSQENKVLLLPFLNQHFQLQEVISEAQKEQLSPDIQDWLRQITELSSEQTRKAAIWFSRYCLNPEKTRSEIQKIFDVEALKQEAEKQNSDQKIDSTEPENKKNQDHSKLTNLPLSDDDKSNLLNKHQAIERDPEKKQFGNYNMNLIVPAICVIVTLIFVVLGIFLINSNSVDQEERQSSSQEHSS